MSLTNEEVSGTNNPRGVNGTPTPVTRKSIPTGGLVSGLISNEPSGSSGSSSEDAVKWGYLRKLKGKKKFFVLRKETDSDKPARLEYYANEKKFRMGQLPKKSIGLKACFNISGTESKCKYSINLHTHNDCVRISMNNEAEMNDWLRIMNALAGEEEDEQHPVEGKPHFEHIWMVTALNKGLGSKENIIGPYRLCLTSKELTLLKVGEHDGRNSVIRFPLNVIRNVSHDATFGCFFHIELGRLASTGPGQISLKTDDNNIAQNMHLLILKAMQNYSKDDVIPRDRVRTYTWNSESNSSMRSFHSTPPGMNRINSMDGSLRIRTDSMSSSTGCGRGTSGMSPPVPILTPTPSISFNSPMCSTDSASSSYSVDYDNNNHNEGLLHPEIYSKSQEEDESYVPWNPGEDQQPSLNSLGSLTLPLNPDMSDYVDTSIVSKDSTSSTAQTPSSYMEVQSPLSPFDNYLPMSPAGAVTNGKSSVSVSHSRNSSLLEENDIYVPMNPGGNHSQSESGAGSTAGSATGLELDDAYLDMDFSRKINLSNEDIQRASPASSESLQSNTPSSDFPLEKVSSYLTDDFEDSMRPMRAYSVGSRSDTSATNKSRSGKNRLEAVQETFRIRAMSVGSKTPRKTGINPNAANIGISSGGSKTGIGPLSSSWSGSTGRWPLHKFSTNNYHPNNYSPGYSHAHTTRESTDSDLMELDFSKNKTKNRKRSLTNQPGSFITSLPSSGNSNKISPGPKGVLLNNSLNEVSPSSETSEYSKVQPTCSPIVENTSSRNYVTSAPISIQRGNQSQTDDDVYPDNNTNTSQSILARLTGCSDLNKLKQMDDEGAYLDMNFTPGQKRSEQLVPSVSTNMNKVGQNSCKSDTTTTTTSKTPNPVVVVTPKVHPYPGTKFSLNFSTSSSLSSLTSPIKSGVSQRSSETSPPLIRSLSSSSNISSTSNNSNSSSASCISIKSQLQNEANQSNSPSLCKSSGTELTLSSLSVIMTGLSRIEESPEKQDNSKASSSGSITPQSPSRPPPMGNNFSNKVDEDESQVTYAAIEHLSQVCRNGTGAFSGNITSSNSCGASSMTPAVTYAQIDFVKNSESIKPNN